MVDGQPSADSCATGSARNAFQLKWRSMTETDSYAKYPSLRDRVVLITGGGSGIGASLVEHFAKQGSQVAFFDLAVEASEALVRELSQSGEHAPLFLRCDVTDIPALQAAIADVSARLGAPQVLVNNAANDDRHHWEEVTPAYWDDRMAVNLRHQFFAAQAVAAGMKAAGGGSIINLSSIAWMIPSTELTVYVTAKAAIVGMTRSLAHDLGAANIRVNCVLPGAVLTERQRRLWMPPEKIAEVMKKQCLKRELMPADVARLILFLASDDSSAITNQNHIIDGGWI
jgi:NAD(P)-dependent dehydrogenase (short-subunit alcohol dehydrogenase family)